MSKWTASWVAWLESPYRADNDAGLMRCRIIWDLAPSHAPRMSSGFGVPNNSVIRSNCDKKEKRNCEYAKKNQYVALELVRDSIRKIQILYLEFWLQAKIFKPLTTFIIHTNKGWIVFSTRKELENSEILREQMLLVSQILNLNIRKKLKPVSPNR